MKNGQLSNAMATAVNTLSKSLAERQIEKWNERELDNMELMIRMIASMKIQHPSQRQLRLMNQDEDSTFPKTGKIGRHPEYDGSHMNTTAPKIHK